MIVDVREWIDVHFTFPDYLDPRGGRVLVQAVLVDTRSFVPSNIKNQRYRQRRPRRRRYRSVQRNTLIVWNLVQWWELPQQGRYGLLRALIGLEDNPLRPASFPLRRLPWTIDRTRKTDRIPFPFKKSRLSTFRFSFTITPFSSTRITFINQTSHRSWLTAIK